MTKLAAALIALVACGFASGAAAIPTVLSFDDVSLLHGSIVTDQYAGANVSIMATNVGGGPGLAVAFDSSLSGTRDSDLEFGNGWSGGNLAPDTVLDNLLIVQENNIGCGDGRCDEPDDEGSRPAGTLIFEFDIPVLSFGFDLVDVEDTMAENGSITFYDGFSTVNIAMMDFLAGFQLGDNSANRVEPFLVADLLGIDQIDRVDINMGGSGAVDNVTFEPVPEPTTATLMGLGLTALAALGRRRQS